MQGCPAAARLHRVHAGPGQWGAAARQLDAVLDPTGSLPPRGRFGEVSKIQPPTALQLFTFEALSGKISADG